MTQTNSNLIAGSEGSGGNVNSRPNDAGVAPDNDSNFNQNPKMSSPDDTLGSRDISGSDLPRGGTLSAEPQTTESEGAGSDIVDRFISALATLERSGEVEAMADLFGQGAELFRNGLGGETPGDFWRRYREAFETVRSEFLSRIGTEDSVCLEWKTTGRLLNQTDFEYRGVSLLWYDTDEVHKFATYFDSAPFGRLPTSNTH